MAKNGNGKQKAWRKLAERINDAVGTKHNGRRAKMFGSDQRPAAASVLVAGLFEKAGIHMPKAEMLRKMLNDAKAKEAASTVDETAEVK